MKEVNPPTHKSNAPTNTAHTPVTAHVRDAILR